MASCDKNKRPAYLEKLNKKDDSVKLTVCIYESLEYLLRICYAVKYPYSEVSAKASEIICGEFAINFYCCFISIVIQSSG